LPESTSESSIDEKITSSSEIYIKLSWKVVVWASLVETNDPFTSILKYMPSKVLSEVYIFMSLVSLSKVIKFGRSLDSLT
jgi:hypothetical protein